MAISLRRLNYVLRTQTQSWTAKEIGVSQSTISRWSRGLTKISNEYANPIRNTYQREAYNVLRDTGASYHQARRFAWYTPETVLDVENQLTEKVNFLATGWAGKKANKIGGEFTLKQLELFAEEGIDIVKDALRQSQEPLEVIFDYGKRK